jgi:hypothetical protein
MKKIHIIPTDKPSSLMIEDGKLLYSKNFGFNEFNETKNFRHINKQHIYITSDEEIKEGDWYLTFTNNEVMGQPRKCEDTNWNFSYCKKIILTTNQDLIKDGVQVIDDKFLEWFVKNPTCESVEVKKVEGRYVDYRGNVHTPISYKTIIPKEEPKHIPYTGKVWEPPKKETLEEAAKRLAEGEGYDTILGVGHIWIEGFEKGAKWQAERSYSKEEVIAIVNRSRETGLTAEYLLLTEQFKKK